MDCRVHVVFTRMDLSDSYSRHTAATMVSVLENCSKPVVFHILHEERISFSNRTQADLNMDKYRELVNRYHGSQIFFHDVKIPHVFYDNSNNKLTHIPINILYRFYIQDILPVDVNFAISLGSDVIVECDLAKIIVCAPIDTSLAGALDQGFNVFGNRRVVKKFYREINYSPKNYINIDVLILNLKKLRQTRRLPDDAVTFILAHPNTPMWEQDILNYLFQDDIFVMNPEYNIIASFGREHVEKTLAQNKTTDYILHYAGPNKPWEEYNGVYDLKYWYYLSMTPWGSEAELFSLMTNVMILPNQVFHEVDRWICHYHSYGKIILTLWKLGIQLPLNIFIKFIKYIIKTHHIS